MLQWARKMKQWRTTLLALSYSAVKSGATGTPYPVAVSQPDRRGSLTNGHPESRGIIPPLDSAPAPIAFAQLHPTLSDGIRVYSTV